EAFAESTANVTAVTGGTVNLPCNITAPTSDDTVAMILWYKGESKTPIYALDARRGTLDEAKRLAMRNKMFMNTTTKPAVLMIEDLVEDDAGKYLCSVYFRKHWNIDFNVSLKLILPPEKPVIMNSNGKTLSTLIGPYNEGDRLVLICEVNSGNPPPSVTWWRDSVLIDETYERTDKGATRNEFQIKSLQRHDLMAMLTCKASNNNITIPS
ncbi:lachesin-like protein, partial [Leptotrombidium deliense]